MDSHTNLSTIKQFFFVDLLNQLLWIGRNLSAIIRRVSVSRSLKIYQKLFFCLHKQCFGRILRLKPVYTKIG